ncbi:hypothetical protein A3L12_08025 [Thermococcus sp. P6]|uniref:hypothetical protein n=1 Tax=Thermococcus sp. P6 TaxID=122420 RepID=UPI000B59E947|nr:hypothetical protein [Thermococcus sp. P6]ASJ11243.1 hypothetical protein A3L12_08025 [Thermococcus sp. P6]
MRIIVRPKRGWRKVVFNIDDGTFRRIELIGHKYGFRVDEIIRILIKGEFLTKREEHDVEMLMEEIKRLERELYEIEGSWAPLKFSSFEIAKDNQNLAIQLSGLIAENKRLRRMLNKGERDYSDIEELIRYYMRM